tara:strand:+ start:1141 stop:1392 length:252 start_codon:yes stop_codon:yes gene_type:complete
VSTRKTFAGALSPFKRRVYRGANLGLKLDSSLAAPISFSTNFNEQMFEDELLDQLVLVIHGIGSAFDSFDLFGLVTLNSIIDR